MVPSIGCGLDCESNSVTGDGSGVRFPEIDYSANLNQWLPMEYDSNGIYISLKRLTDADKRAIEEEWNPSV